MLFVGIQLAATLARNEIPNDFGQFYVASELLANGDLGSIYDVERFRQEIEESPAFNGKDLSDLDTLVRPFGYPPVFLQAFRPLTLLPVATAHLIYLLLGTGLAAAGLWSLRPGFVPLSALITFPVLLTVDLGQNGLYTIAVLAAAAVFMLRGRNGIAGIVLGLLVFKPQWLLAVALPLLLLGRNGRRVVVSAVTTAGGLVALSWLASPAAWATYLPNALALARTEDPVIDLLRVGAFDLAATFTSARTGLALFGIAVAAGALAWFRNNRTERGERAGLALALLIGIWISPWTLLYDWAPVAVPFTLLSSVPSRDNRRVWLWAGFCWTTALSRELYSLMIGIGAERVRLVSIIATGLLVGLAYSLRSKDLNGRSAPSAAPASTR